MTSVSSPTDGRYWFPAKRYGWGWGLPSAWQGWVVMASYIVGMLVDGVTLAGRHTPAFAVIAAALFFALIGVCYLKGERPRWRWGG